MMPTMQHEIHKVFTATVTKGPARDTNVFTISTGSVDRDNDRLDPHTWKLDAFKANPVVLFGHSHADLPIAKCVDIKVVGDKLKATIEWPPEGVYPFADTVKAMVRNGFLNATSVGFRSAHSELNPYGGRDHRGQELCEFSLVPIPSNADALVERGLNRMQLKSWLGNSGRKQSREGSVMKTVEDDEMYLEITDDFYEQKADAALQDLDNYFDLMLQAMRSNSTDQQVLSMAAQMARLGPNATIADLCRAMMRDGVMAPKSYDIDERELAGIISRVVAEEYGKQVRSALNHAVGRLD